MQTTNWKVTYNTHGNGQSTLTCFILVADQKEKHEKKTGKQHKQYEEKEIKMSSKYMKWHSTP